jgi:hypothetical protein
MSTEFMIPETVTHEQVMEAIQPLCELLNITPSHFYDKPGLTVGFNEITFLVPGVDSVEEWTKPRPASRKAELQKQGRGIAEELQQFICVKVVRPDEDGAA